MAGGFRSKFDPKNLKHNNSGFTSEFLKSSGGNKVSSHSPETPKKVSFSGILGLGQSIEFDNKKPFPENNSNLIFSHLEQEHQALNQNLDQEVQKEIDSIRVEISKLIQVTQNLDVEIEKVALDSHIDTNQYQLNFLQRIRMILINFRKNISESTNWLHLFESKKRKKNAFWNNVKKKQGGGEQYLFSNEHSAARSAT